MLEEQARASAWRMPWWLVTVLLVVAVGVGFGAGALVWAGDSDQPAQAQKSLDDGASAKASKLCPRQVNINFDGTDPDPAMRTAADQLRDDPRFESVKEQTRQEAFEEFKETFADEPELVDVTRPEALPASVRLVVREGTTAKEIKGQLSEEFPEAEVTGLDYCPK